MHQGNRDWLASLGDQYAKEIAGSKVLEIGSMIWNGTARPYFSTAARYVGVDHCPGDGVDIVCQGSETKFTPGEFDILICLSVFEHDPDWRETFGHNLQWIRDGGLLIVCWGAEGNFPHAPDPFAVVPVRAFTEAAKEWPVCIVDSFLETERFTPDCPGCYDVVARKIPTSPHQPTKGDQDHEKQKPKMVMADGDGLKETLGQKLASLMFFNMQGNARLCGSEMAAHMPTLALLARHWSFGQVVELGVGRGHSTSALITGLEGVDRKLISYDFNPAAEQSFWKILGLPGRCPEINWEFRVKDSMTAAFDFPDGKVSLLFIDTNHRYEETAKELFAWLPKMHPRGVICGHGYYLEKMGDVICGVKKAVDNFAERWKEKYMLQALPHDQGLFILWPK